MWWVAWGWGWGCIKKHTPRCFFSRLLTRRSQLECRLLLPPVRARSIPYWFWGRNENCLYCVLHWAHSLFIKFCHWAFFCIHETRYVSDVKVRSKSILARVLQIWRWINPVLTIRWPYLNKVVLFLCLVLSSHMETELHRLSTQEALPIFGVQQDAKLFKQECFINWCSVYPAQTRHW